MTFSFVSKILLALFLMGGPLCVCAADPLVPPAEPSVAAPETPDFLKPQAAPSFPIVRVLFTLALLVGALYFVKPLLQKTKWGGGASGMGGLDVVGRASLGPRAGLCLVRAEGRRFLVGVGADGVRLLAELGDRSSDENQPLVSSREI